MSFREIKTHELPDLPILPADVLSLVNRHLIENYYAEKDLTTLEIQALFASKYRHDDLSITYLRNFQTGVEYIRIRSYPGDNEYGQFYTLGGDRLAEIHDGDTYLLQSPGVIYCGDL